ncbi:hypothetical protein CLAIMM_02648 [Cladophialophora immunda]|nr:hypothetical protein CLAIMM_02648 [Cladophialophora immunda]
MLRYAVYLVPASAALALVALNLAEYYVGGELSGPSGHDDEKLGALQFAAKVHEFLMIASLVAVFFTYLRAELVGDGHLPQRILSTDPETGKSSLKCSPGLRSTIKAMWKRAHKNWVLVTLLISCTLLAVSVGPSTASLMQPRLGYWPAGGTDFWTDAAFDRLQPGKMEFDSSLAHCKTDTGDLACPYGDWQLIQRQYHAYWPDLRPMGSMPESIALSSPLSARSMAVRHRSTENADTRSIWQNAYSSATTQQSITADGVSETGRLWAFAAANSRGRQKFKFRRDARYTSTAPQPVVQARCTEQLVDVDALNDLEIQFPVLKAPDCVGDASGCFVDPATRITCHNSSFIEQIKSLMTSTNQPALTWVDGSTCQIPANSSVGAVATFPLTSAGDSGVYTCTVDGRSANTTASGTRDNPKVVTGCPPDFHAVGTNNPLWPRTTISADWAQLLFPELPGQNATAFSITAAAAGVWDAASSPPSASYNYPFIVEGILAAAVANGIARSTYNSSLVGRLKGLSSDDSDWEAGLWSEDMLPKRGLGWGESIYNISSDVAANSTRLVMRAAVLGYAWSYRGVLQQVHMAVLAMYSIFALGGLSVAILQKSLKNGEEQQEEQ